MSAIHRIGMFVLIPIVLAGLSACATKTLPVEGYAPTVDISGLQRDDSEAPTIIYRRPGAPGLGEFDRFIIDPVQVFYDDPGMKELSPEQVGRMQQYLLDALVRELSDAGFEVGTRSEAGTLRIAFTLSGLRAGTAAPNVTAAVVPIAVNVGSVTVEAVFRDALTNRLEGVAVTRARGARWLNPTPWSTWSDVQQFFDGWARGFRQAVVEAHAR